MTELISTELRRRKAATELNDILNQVTQLGEPISMNDIQSEVDAVRARKKAREARN